MSNAAALKCDVCGALALCKFDGAMPDNWGTARVTRVRPALDTGNLDLCGGCFQMAYDVVRKGLVKELRSEIANLKWQLEDR